MKTHKSFKKAEFLRSNERGTANHGWLKSHHSFSFANYYNPQQMGFSDLRVINDDYIAAKGGFPTHPHSNMEIFSYVTEGALAHKDTMNNEETIQAGDVQIMSAGTGVAHSEFNPTNTTTHLFQIWLYPSVEGGNPRYQQKRFLDSEKQGKLRLIISPDERDGSLGIKQNAFIYAGLFDGVEETNFPLKSERSYYLHVLSGEIDANGELMETGDALKIFEDDGELILNNATNAEVLFFDLNKH